MKARQKKAEQCYYRSWWQRTVAEATLVTISKHMGREYTRQANALGNAAHKAAEAILGFGTAVGTLHRFADDISLMQQRTRHFDLGAGTLYVTTADGKETRVGETNGFKQASTDRHSAGEKAHRVYDSLGNQCEYD